jgi:pimeloyl-ACP methyl ester carboxylesterase
VADPGGVTTSTVCFAAHSGVVPTRLIGTRFASSKSDPNRVMLLVYGHAGLRQLWDWQPNYSVARNFARAGYLVITYDRLTSGESTFQPSVLGDTVTYDADREMISEIIEQIRGTYPFPVEAPSGPCSYPGAGAGRHPKVILIGHSLGGAMAGSYAGLYSKIAPVDAVVQADWSNGGDSDEANRDIDAKAASPADIAAGYATIFLDDGSTPASKSVSAQTCAETTRLLLPAGLPVSSAALATVCDPSSFAPVPYGDYVSAAASNQENEALIANTPSQLPVLLVFADHDCLFPPASSPSNPSPCASTTTGGGCDSQGCQQDEVNIWKTLCPCKGNVSTWTEPDSGHSFMYSETMPEFTDAVVSWLHSRSL